MNSRCYAQKFRAICTMPILGLFFGLTFSMDLSNLFRLLFFISDKPRSETPASKERTFAKQMFTSDRSDIGALHVERHFVSIRKAVQSVNFKVKVLTVLDKGVECLSPMPKCPTLSVLVQAPKRRECSPSLAHSASSALLQSID